jgi:hypothetical protein
VSGRARLRDENESTRSPAVGVNRSMGSDLSRAVLDVNKQSEWAAYGLWDICQYV